MTAREEVKTIGLLLLTSDRGLAGSYNVNMITLAERFLAATPIPAKVITVGRKGRDADGPARLQCDGYLRPYS
jgi:F-type H+-transporting ATPase subunit gamma